MPRDVVGMQKNIGQLALFLFFLLFVAHGLFMYMERYVFTNEIFSAIGLLILLTQLMTKKFVVPKTAAVILFVLAYSAFSFVWHYHVNVGASAYEKLRTTPIAYSL